uniref:ABC transporter permease n=1 Tax=Eiseniibacteriota bacterium TaxID=2212470 RepID=A0A832I2Y8_UNCEI
MTALDLAGLSAEALHAHRLRYALSALAIAVGIAAVVLMVSIGEGMRLFIIEQVSSFGTTLISVNPGKVETRGGMPGAMGGSVRKLTLDDARAMKRLPGVAGVVPVAYGTALVEYGNRGRRVFIYGVSHEAPAVWSMPVAAGRFLPELDYERGAPVAVLGPKLKRELFGDANALGETVRIGESRFRVIGLMASKGQFLGFDLDDTAYIPVGSAMRLLNRSELDEVDVRAASTDAIDPVAERLRALMIERHDGHEDVTIVTQKDAQVMVSNILGVVTTVVSGIAAISLLVGAIGILTIMWIVVRERTAEIGLVKAIGARRGQILAWYLAEAAATALAGGLGGLLAGMGGGALLAALVPGLQSHTSPLLVLGALAMAVTVGIASGVAPAMQAARLDPVQALRGE